jgi:periplasmic protein TonB
VTDATIVHPRVEHMPPAAVALAVLLHAVVGACIWWLSPLRTVDPQEEPIMVMFDSSPSNVGLQDPARTGPPAESVAASPAPSTAPNREPERQQQALAAAQPEATATPSRPSQAMAQPEPVPTLPIYEFSIPPVPEPPPAPTSRDFPKPPAAAPPRPAQRTLPLPRRPAPPAQQRPAAEAPAAIPAPLPGPNPADRFAGQGRQRNDYLSRVFRQLERYRVYPAAARDNNLGGRVVTRVTINRNGGLIDALIDTSSGVPVIDRAELEAIRKAAPFPPVPSDMPGDPVILVLRMTYGPPGRGR